MSSLHIPVSGPRQRRLSLTPLIDVIFLLLLFFMLTSVFARHVRIEVTAPAGGVAEVQAPSVVLAIAPGMLRLNGEATGIDALRASLQEIAASRRSAEALRILVTVSEDADAQLLADVLLAADGIDGLSILLARR